MFQDLRFGARMLLKKPGFTLIGVMTLALGIGANTAIFSVVLSVLVRPLLYHEPERLVWLTNTNPSLGVGQTFMNPADILDIREQAQSVEQIASWGTYPFNLLSGSKPERIEGVCVTPNFFQMLGVKPMLGRDFVREDDREDAFSVIISHSLWQRQFGGASDVIGRKITLAWRLQGPVTIIGVLPPDSQFPARIELFYTYSYEGEHWRGGSHNDRVIARLKPGVTVAQAQAELSAIARRIADQFPDTNKGWDVVVTPFRQYLFGGAETALPLLLGVVGFVLLIACANVANLQLARGAGRASEIAVRLALGASAWRIVRQLLTENLSLASLGGACGMLLAWWGVWGLRVLGPDSVPRLKDATINAPTLWFTAALVALTGVLCGIVPALQSSRLNLNETLKDAGNSRTVAPSRQWFRNAMVVSQVALALMLLTGAGLLLKSFWKLQQTNLGFQTENVLAAGVSLNKNEYPDPPRRSTQFYQQALERVANLPGVEAAAAISHLPFGGRTMQLEVRVEGHAPISTLTGELADYRVVTPRFFETLSIPIKRGRAFTESDTTQTPLVYVVNEAFARAYFPDGEPVGRRIRLGYEGKSPGEIIGVVGDVKHRSVETEAIPAVYVCYLQTAKLPDILPHFPIMNFVVRAKGDAVALAGSVRRELQAVDPNQVVFYVRPLTDFISDAVAQRRFNMLLLALFATLALILAAAGIYGVLTYTVTQRTRELGIRFALGATGADALRLVIGQGMKLAMLGVGAGLLTSLALTRLLRNLLYGVSATDPLIFATVSLLSILVSLIACYLPARRATKVDPLIALRSE
ncbi:MAG TPA: ABC transporter permease [Blastocatellia bacterium]|jgi:putative ABC transport system permease protein|nr:ABC transporter permease [Blastocatellia bacterium]